MATILFFVAALALSIILAKVEINVEGAKGYARDLPVEWRVGTAWVRKYVVGTSYHFYQGLLLLGLLHVPFVLGLDWTLSKEMLALSMLAFVTVFEDFLWFALNSSWGKEVKAAPNNILGRVKKFKPENIKWFEDRWLIFCPAWYWWYLPAATGLYLLR